jgi:hypothetical protein
MSAVIKDPSPRLFDANVAMTGKLKIQRVD